MGNDIYNDRPNRITQRLTQILKPLGYNLCFDNRGLLRSVKKGTISKPYPYFYKDKKGKIYMKIKSKNNTINKCIDKETDEWLAYYAYKEIIKN